MDDVAIKIDDVSKDFRLPDEKLNSIKGHIVHPFKRRDFKKQHALKNISVDIKKGEFFGIVGRNGSGKSTLLKIIAGIYQPSRGKISVSGKLVPFIELGVGFNPELTGKENVYLNGALLGFSKKEIDAQYEDIVAFAELKKFMNQKLKNYSSGMQVRLAFSMAIRAKADILLVDEVLAVGDADFQRKCFSYFKELKANKKTVIFVTHDMSSVREYCDRAMLIDNSEIKFIGDAENASKKYSLLFIGNESAKSKTGAQGDRWGDGQVQINDVKTSFEGKDLVVKVKAQAKKDTNKVIYGLHVLAEDGKEVTAMNNRMIHSPDVESISKGTNVEFEWRMLNIFNDGKYFVTLTLIDDVGNTLDWITKADTFEVKTMDRSTTSILPPLRVDYNIKKGSHE